MMADGNGRLQGRTAVVTGAGRGIGKAICEAFVREGAAVVLAARTTSEIEQLAADLTAHGGRATAIACDVTDDAQVQTLAEQAKEDFGSINVLVNNAGTTKIARFPDYEVADFQHVMDVNFMGVVRMTQAFLPDMVQAGEGRIINIASTAGKYGSMFQSPYNSSKHAVVGLTKCLGLENAKTGVTVNAICPGFVDTPLIDTHKPHFAQAAGIPEEQAEAMLLQRVPMGRLLKPEEVAHLAVYIASKESAAMTGQAMTISGGLILV